MRRFAILSLVISTLITGYVLIPATPASAATTPATAITISRPSQAELSAAVAKVEAFADYAKFYDTKSTNATQQITSNHPYYREYEYLHSLVTKTNILIDRYDDVDFVNRLEPGTYNTALEAIDQALIGCSYLFGIIRDQHLAQTTAAANSTPASATTAAPTSAKAQTTAKDQTATSPQLAATNEQPSARNQKAASTPANASQVKNTATTPAVPNTGEEPVAIQTSSLPAALISILATLAITTGYYLVGSRRAHAHKVRVHCH